MIGTRLAHYEIVEKVGEGGMGAVYRARDTKLDRDVALKVLPERFADDAERLARFHREARTLAALNHPNIAAIHDLESDRGRHFLVMELVAGDDLSARIAQGPLPAEEAVRIARGIAEGLEEAHARGIVHRDLKPANVKVPADGMVKVLDFGLARAFLGESTAEEDIGNSPTLTAMTGAGVILGTAAYMSPEQARGTPLDRRTDIWSFGAVLYEMLTGRRVFEGETVSDTLAGILKTDPDWDLLPDDTPEIVRHLLVRCLQRDRRQRLQDMGEARILLSGDATATPPPTLLGAAPAQEAGPAPRRGRLLLVALAALVVGAVLGGAVVRWSGAPGTEPRTRWFDVAPSTGENGLAESPAISPDGAMAVYEHGDRLWLRRFDTGTATALSGTEGGRHPFWSPDSRQIGFLEGRRVLRLAVDGGAPLLVSELPGQAIGAGATWADDGRIIVTTGTVAGLYEVPERGGGAALFSPVDSTVVQDLHDPFAIPGGRGLLYSVHLLGGTYSQIHIHRDGVSTLVHDAGENRVDHPVWSESGHVVFAQLDANAGVWAVPWDLDGGRARGEPFLVVGGGSAPSVAADGTLLCAASSADRNWQLVRCDRDGNVVERHGAPQLYSPFFALSHDQERMTVLINDDTRSRLWTLDLRRGTQTRLTFDDLTYSAMSWAPDGATIYASGGTAGSPPAQEIFAVSAEGLHPPRKLARGAMPTASRDGRLLVYSDFSSGMDADLVARDLAAGEEPRVLVSDASMQYFGAVSPDGGLLAYVSRETDRDEVYVRRLPRGDQKRQVSVDGGGWPQWSADGDRLWYMAGEDVMEVAVAREPRLRLGSPRQLFTRPPGEDLWQVGWPLFLQVADDGESFYMLHEVESGRAGRPLLLVQNWAAELAAD